MYEKRMEKPSTSVIPESESPTTGLNSIDRFVSPDTDVPSILTILMGQTGLIIGVILLEIFTGFGITPPGGSFTFSPQALSLVGAISIPLFLADLAFKNIGWQFAKEVERNSGVFTLRLLGRSTHSVAAAFTTLLLSVASGINSTKYYELNSALILHVAFSEEIFFRGYSINVIQAYSDVTTAAIATSIIYGLAHFPFTFGATAIFEGVLGAFYAFAFYYSGFNLAVPILLHLLYDFSTLFVTWYNASRDLNRNLAIAEKIRLLPSEDPKRFDEMCKVVCALQFITKAMDNIYIRFLICWISTRTAKWIKLSLSCLRD
jgi:membrane protease YdiL (CAAX protease family)